MFYITLVSKELQLSCQVNEADIGQLKVGQTATFTVNAFPNKNFSATVKSIAPQATTISNVQMFNVVLATQENESLKAGMPVNVNIVTDSRSHVLRVPMAAMNFTKTFSGSTSYSSANGQNRSEQGARSNGNQAGGSTVGNNGSNNRSNNDNGGMQRDRSANGGVTRSGGGEQVLVLKNGVPTRVRITTGLKDDVSAEVTQGLQEGDEVIVGSTTPGGTSGTQGGANRSQQNQRSQGMPGLGMPRIRS